MIEQKLKILVVEDTAENRDLIRMYMKRMGHVTVCAENGKEAIEAFEKERPDIILMDVMMPVMDGYEATRKIREMCGSNWVPIIFLSANVELEDQIKGLEAGGDDYLPKPINLSLLKAKVGAMQRIAEMQKQLNQYHSRAQDEMNLARKLIDNMTHHTGLKDSALEYWFESAEHLSGDLISASRTIDERLYVMVADATGHGLSAAMSQLPVSQCFYEMTKRGYSLSSIIAEINTKLTKMLTAERYVAGIFASIDFKNKIIEVWNGASPDAYFVDASGNILHRFPSAECPLGIIDDGTYKVQTEVYQWHTPGELLLFSDGLLDAADANHECFGDERLLDLLQNTNRDGSWFSTIKQSIGEFYCRQSSFDDISLASVICDVDAVSEEVNDTTVVKFG